jgi:integrase/recombinase XerD
MSALGSMVEDYLTVRRALGYKLKDHGGLLADFVTYLDDVGATTVTTDHAVAWACRPADTDEVWWARRLGVVRGFARHVKAFDPATEVPPTDVLAYRVRRATPYLYSPEEVTALMAAADSLTPEHHAATYQTVIGLLKVSGMRVGEVIRLDDDDIDFDEGLLTIWHTKFNKSRQVPLHPTTLQALGAYTRLRDQHFPRPKTTSVFVSTVGTRLIYNNVQRTFSRLAGQAGLTPRAARCRPRLHDFRHSMAVETLLGWYRAGLDVEARLPLLSTYLGHSEVANTYWYLSAVPELLALAAERREHTLGRRP